MKKILALVEGQTEETFVKQLLNPHFESLDIYLIPTIIATKRVKNGPDFKGGISSYNKIKNDLLRLLNDTSAQTVTSFIDYYRLPDDFPGKDTLSNKKSINAVEYLENEFSKDINDKKFIPYLMLHEFEALVFVSPDEFNYIIPNSTISTQLKKIKKQFQNPEEINDGQDTHPSARILEVMPKYQKPLYGSIITKRIGLDKIRSECSHFDSWLTKLENI